MLSPAETERYARHLSLPEIGAEGQLRLKEAAVLCIGAGGLGSPAATYLAAAGVGRLGLVDFDRVDASNLQRQTLHATADVGRLKTESARERLSAINPEIAIETYAFRLEPANVDALFERYDVIVDGSDNSATRLLVNDACLRAGKPLVSAAVHRFEGRLAVFGRGESACYRCVFPDDAASPFDCVRDGVLGAVTGVLGSLQALETLKLLTGAGEPLAGKLLVCDLLAMRFRTLEVPRRADCPACGEKRTKPATEPRTSLSSLELSTEELQSLVARRVDFDLVDVREKEEHEDRAIPNSRLIPLGSLVARANQELDPEREIVVYCRSGARSSAAAAKLRMMGFEKARSLAGGISAWN